MLPGNGSIIKIKKSKEKRRVNYRFLWDVATINKFIEQNNTFMGSRINHNYDFLR